MFEKGGIVSKSFMDKFPNFYGTIIPFKTMESLKKDFSKEIDFSNEILDEDKMDLLMEKIKEMLFEQIW